MEWYRSYVFLVALCTRGIVDMVDLSDIVKRPYGPRMCRQLCESFTGCRGHTLNSSSLTCQLISQRCVTPMIEKDTAKENKLHTGNLSCSKFSRLLQTRNKQLKCVKELDKRESQGILLVQKGRRNCYFHYFNVTTKSLQPLRYNTTNVERVYTLAYVSKLNQVMVGRMKQLDGLDLFSGKRRFYRMIAALAMCVDENAELLFLIVRRQNYFVCRLSTRGQQYRVLVQVKYFNHITVDPECRIVYISGPSGLASFNFDGARFQEIVGGIKIIALTLNAYENIIYFASGESLYKLSNASEPEFIESFGMSPVMLTSDNEQIYIIYHKDITVDIFNVKSRKFVNILTPTGKEVPYIMCLLH